MGVVAKTETFLTRLLDAIFEAVIVIVAAIAAAFSVIPQLLAVAMMACVWGGIVYGLVDLIVALD